MTTRATILRGMKYAIVEVPCVGQRVTVLGIYNSLRSADTALRQGQRVMQVVIDAMLGKPGAHEALCRISEAICIPGIEEDLPDNVIRLERIDDSHTVAVTWVEATSLLRAAVIASRDLYEGQRLTRDDVFRLAFRANAIRCTSKRRSKR